MSDPERSGRVEYPNQGFAVTWDEHGMTIEVTDYHAGLLKLPWSAVFSMASCAGQQTGSAPTVGEPATTPSPKSLPAK